MQPELHSRFAAERLRDDHGARPDETPELALRQSVSPGEQEGRVPLPPRLQPGSEQSPRRRGPGRRPRR